MAELEKFCSTDIFFSSSSRQPLSSVLFFVAAKQNRRQVLLAAVSNPSTDSVLSFAQSTRTHTRCSCCLCCADHLAKIHHHPKSLCRSAAPVKSRKIPVSARLLPGGYEYNGGLSQRRADSVVRTLASRYGVAAARLKAAGVGLLAPVAPNDTEDHEPKIAGWNWCGDSAGNWRRTALASDSGVWA